MLTLHALYRYPVKSLAAQPLGSALVGPRGLEHDRAWMVVDAAGEQLTQRTLPAMVRLVAQPVLGGISLCDGLDRITIGHPVDGLRDVTVWEGPVPALDAGDLAASWLSDRLGQPVRLVYQPPHLLRPVDPRYANGDQVSFADGFPLLVVNLASVEATATAAGLPAEPLRYRPNLVIAGAEPFAEDHWRRLTIGEVVIDLVKPCARCVMVNNNPATGRSGTEPLATLARTRKFANKVIFGQNALVRGGGTLLVGQPVHCEP